MRELLVRSPLAYLLYRVRFCVPPPPTVIRAVGASTNQTFEPMGFDAVAPVDRSNGWGRGWRRNRLRSIFGGETLRKSATQPRRLTAPDSDERATQSLGERGRTNGRNWKAEHDGNGTRSLEISGKTIVVKGAACPPSSLSPCRASPCMLDRLKNQTKLTARVEEGIRHHANQVLHEVEEVTRRSRPGRDHDLGRLPRARRVGAQKEKHVDQNRER